MPTPTKEAELTPCFHCDAEDAVMDDRNGDPICVSCYAVAGTRAHQTSPEALPNAR